MAKHIHVHLGKKTRDADRAPVQSDLDAAARGLKMTSKSPSELDEIIRQHEGKDMFASKVIVAAAKQMKAAKLRMGATRDSAEGDRLLKEELDRVEAKAKYYKTIDPYKSRQLSNRAAESRSLLKTQDAGDVRIVHNKLLGGWYVVRGPHQTPLSGRFDSKEEAQAWLDRHK